MKPILDWLPSLVSVVIATVSVLIKLLETNFKLDSEFTRTSLLSAMLALLVILFDVKLNSMRSTFDQRFSLLEKDFSLLKREHRDYVYDAIDKISPEYLREVVRDIADKQRDTLLQSLDNIVGAAKHICKEEDYLEQLRDKVRDLRQQKAGEVQISAACGQKTWGIPMIYEYWDENIEAARRGATIARIFAEGEHGLPKDVHEGALRQKQAGIRVRKLSEAARSKLPGRYNVPSDIGFVVIETSRRKQVCIHWGPVNVRRGFFLEENDPIYPVSNYLKMIFYETV
jgi:hypothetical protein